MTYYSEALSNDRLEQPWRDWAKIAHNFSLQLREEMDREDLAQNIIVRLAEVAEQYRQEGRPFTRWSCIKVAEYTRLRFYHQQKRWKRVSSVSLHSPVRDEDGNERELIETIIDEKGIDWDAYLDLKNFYLSRPRRERKAIRKLVMENWRKLSGNDSKLIKSFRTAAEPALALT